MTIYIYEGTFYALLLWATTSLRGWCWFYSARNTSIKKLEQALSPPLSGSAHLFTTQRDTLDHKLPGPWGFLKEPGQAAKFWCLTFYKSATITIPHGINQWPCVEYFNDTMFFSTSIFKEEGKVVLLISTHCLRS